MKGRNLQERIDALVHAGLLGADEAKILHKIRFLGNKAAHEMSAPSEVELSAAMDIAELLATVYVLPKTSRQLRSAKK